MEVYRLTKYDKDMIGSLIGAGVQVGSMIAGQARAARLARQQNKIIDQQEKDNQNWFDRRYNESYTQRSDAQAVLSRMNEAMKERSKRSAGVNAVMGGTTQAAAAEKQAQNNAMGNVMANIASQASAHKDSIENAYMKRKDALTNARLNVLQGQMQSATQAANQGVAAGASIGAGLAGQINPVFKKKPTSVSEANVGSTIQKQGLAGFPDRL